MARKSIDRTGERNINKQGLWMKVVKYNGNLDMIVKFDIDGYECKKQYKAFKDGSIKHPNFKGVYNTTNFKNEIIKSNIVEVEPVAICNNFTFDGNEDELKEWLHYEFGISKQNIANIFWSNYSLDNIKEIDSLIIPALNINYRRSSIKSKCKLNTHPWELVECEAFTRINCNGRLNDFIKASKLRGSVAGSRLETSNI